jgi:hypothetical protein
MNATTARLDVRILQVTCSHCGHVREFERDQRLSVEHLERMSTWPCIQCSIAGQCVFSFYSCDNNQPRALERLPTLLHSIGDCVAADGADGQDHATGSAATALRPEAV